jgi:hypothetical protein
MTNKRITELTALDGDDVADNDVLAIVDVSDTTMAASGTTKKITVAELVTDSALTNKFWPNSSTALTGANLANTDRLAVLDVGTPDVPKYITADELAQGSQFSGRYKPLANDRLWVPAQTFAIISGCAFGILNTGASAFERTEVLLFDASTAEIASCLVATPPSWSTFNLYVWWTNAGAGSGDVVWAPSVLNFGDTESTASVSWSGTTTTGTAPLINITEVTQMTGTFSASSSKVCRINLRRTAADVADTLTNDAGLIGIELVRAS